MCMQAPGTYAYFSTVESFLNTPLDKWLQRMIEATDNPGKSQVVAWQDCYAVLHSTFAALPQAYRKLHLVFEYALPRYPLEPGKSVRPYSVFADVILLSSDTVTVLEFKGHRDSYWGDARCARKYRRRIQNFHDQSRGMSKRAVLVLTKVEGLKDEYFKVQCRAHDLLPETLLALLGEHPKRHPAARQWCASTFSCKAKAAKDVSPKR